MALCAVPTDFRGSVSERSGAGVMRDDVDCGNCFLEM